MIKAVNLRPFDGSEDLPAYVYKNTIGKYTLVATAPGGYKVVFARLTVGSSKSGSEELTHALFESYDTFGNKMKETRTRVGGYDREFLAAKYAMIEAGIEFENIAPCHFSKLLNALGAFYNAVDPDIQEYTVMSQSCH